MWSALVLLASALGGGATRAFTESDVYKLPELYHLDDYGRCLSQPGALYCVATLRLSADRRAPAYYRMIEEYSSSPLTFNRTLLHRGYCVSRRCPSGAPHETRRARLERCARRTERAPGLRVALHSHHCDVATRREAAAPRDKVFLWVVGSLLLLNLAATLYDVSTGSRKKSKLLVAWSIRANWHRLTADYEDGDSQFTSLAPVQGIRVLLLLMVIIIHVVAINHQLFLHNPHHVEQLFHHPLTMIWRNGTSVVQIFVVLSNFLFAYSLLALSRNKSVGFAQLPIYILHRVMRLLPVHLLVVGFAASWWRFAGAGPQWARLVRAESDICRRKFHLHSLFAHNLVDNERHCLVQTWFLAVDVQLFIVASLVMVTLMKARWSPVPVLVALFTCSCLTNGLLAYYNEWNSSLHIMVPEQLRSSLHGSRTFSAWYSSPWGSLPACLLGLLLAHVHSRLQQRGYDIHGNRLFVWLYQLALPLQLAWLAGGARLTESGALASALYVALERPVTSLLFGVTFLGIINNVHSTASRALSWRGWHAAGRVSLAALMLHWCVHKTLVASRGTLTDFTILNVAAETSATCFFTYCLAFPLTVLVEMPLMKTFTTLVLK